MSEIIFKSICGFVSDLGELFSSEIHSVALYERLLNKTTLAHTEAVSKHINCFRKFCVENKDAILAKSTSFTENIVTFSPKVFIDMNHVFSLSDESSREAIWDHLLTLLALLDPSSGAKEVLKSSHQIAKVEGEGDEGDFLNNIIEKVEKHVSGTSTSNPQEAIAEIMSSGMITDLVSSLNTGISSGKLDLGKMMASVQKMIGNVSGGETANTGNPMEMFGGAGNPMEMLSTMMGMMGNKM